MMRLRVRAPSLGQLTIRLADSLVVRSVVSDQFGRLFSLRVMNQNTILVNLPATVLQDTEMTVTIEYSGRLEPQAPERETVMLQRDQASRAARKSTTRSSRNRMPVSLQQHELLVSAVHGDRLRHGDDPDHRAGDYGCVASGEQRSDSPRTIPPAAAGAQPRKVYEFSAARPLRYFSFLVTKLNRADRWTVVVRRRFAARRHARSGAPVVERRRTTSST